MKSEMVLAVADRDGDAAAVARWRPAALTERGTLELRHRLRH
jgi:hypothetical protein